jgi:hypothetical protein
VRSSASRNTLLVYPDVKLMVSCPCGYRKAYRLARVAEHDGADIALDTLLINCTARVSHHGVMQSKASVCKRRVSRTQGEHRRD